MLSLFFLSASKADRVYRHFTRSHSSPCKHSVDALRSVLTGELVCGTASGSISDFFDLFPSGQTSDPHGSPIKHYLNSSNPLSSNFVNHSGQIQEVTQRMVASGQALSSSKPVSSAVCTPETESDSSMTDLTSTNANLATPAADTSLSFDSHEFRLKRPQHDKTNSDVLDFFSPDGRNTKRLPPNSPVNSIPFPVTSTNQSEQQLYSPRILLEPVADYIISALHPTSVGPFVTSANDPSHLSKNPSVTSTTRE